MNAPARLSALDRAIAEIEALAPKLAATRNAMISDGAAIMVKQPWRITRAIRPWSSAMWVEPTDLDAWLAEARRHIASQREHAREGRLAYFNSNRLIALEQAERALTVLAAQTLGG